MNLHHLALRVSSVRRSLDFYTGVLGLQVIRADGENGRPGSAWLRAGDVVVMIEETIRGRPAAQGSGHVLAFGVSSLADWESRLESAGVAIDDRTQSTLYVSDPDGHRIGLSVYSFDRERAPAASQA